MTGWYQDKPYYVLARCSNLLFVRCLWGRKKEINLILEEDFKAVDYDYELEPLAHDSRYLLNSEAVMIREAENKFGYSFNSQQ